MDGHWMIVRRGPTRPSLEVSFLGDPHAIHRGSITTHRNANVPKEVASNRMDVSGEVLDKHYDMATPDEKRERRREFLHKI